MTTPLEAWAEALKVKQEAGKELDDADRRASKTVSNAGGAWGCASISIVPCWNSDYDMPALRLTLSDGGGGFGQMPGKNACCTFTSRDARKLAYALLELVGDGKEPSDEAEA